MLAEQPVVAAIGLHLGDFPVEPGDYLRVVRVLQADQNVQAVFAQGPGQKSHRIAYLG
ncbi:hypothetical protein D3C81_2296250 [compost metagenome]